MKQTYYYLPLSDMTRFRSLYVLAAGSAHIPPDTPYPPSTHPEHHRFQWHNGRILQEYQLIYIARGGGKLETRSGGLRQLRAGDVFILFPTEWHRYNPDPQTGWDEHWIAFQGENAAAITTEHLANRENPVFHTNLNDTLLQEFLRIEAELAAEEIGCQLVVAARTMLILALVTASHQRQSLPAAYPLEVIRRAKSLLRERIHQPTDLQELAAELHVSYSWLRKAFRQHTDLAPAQYQMQLRLSHACDLLRNTVISIAEVGSRSGFESAYYFARIFRSKIGCPPSTYRASFRNDIAHGADSALPRVQHRTQPGDPAETKKAETKNEDDSPGL